MIHGGQEDWDVYLAKVAMSWGVVSLCIYYVGNRTHWIVSISLRKRQVKVIIQTHQNISRKMFR